MPFRYSGTNWRGQQWVASDSVKALGTQIDQIPNRPTGSDGTVASKTHDQVSPSSDHSPQPKTGIGIVRAIDATVTNEQGQAICEALRANRDPRIKYVIYQSRLFASYWSPNGDPWTWRPYGGSNPHDTHVHVSMLPIGDNDSTPFLSTQGDDDMSLVARLMVVEAAAKTWLPDQASIDYWMLRADNLDNPTYAAEWRRDFEQMWALEKQNEWKKLQGHPHGASTTVDQVARSDAADARALALKAQQGADKANTDLAQIKSVIG
jgi:hypothetical protein